MDLQQLDPFRHSIRTPSADLSYLDLGRGPVALFVHGIGTNAYLWRNVIGLTIAHVFEDGASIENLGDERRCIALDLPLHGQSPARADQDFSVAALAGVLEEFCAALELTDIDLVGNDTGGAICQIFSALHPERLATLTLTNCETHDNLPPAAFQPTVDRAADGTLAPAVLHLLGNTDAARTRVFGSLYEHAELVSDELVRAFLEPVFGTLERGRAFERLVGSLRASDLLAVEDRLQQLEVPTLVVWGTDDPNFDTRWAYWLRDTIPGMREVVELEGARLLFPDERAADFAPLLRRHWARAARSREPVLRGLP